MSEEIKKNLRTQGKYSDKGPKKDKKQKESPNLKVSSENFFPKRNSYERKEEPSTYFEDAEDESPIKYEKNSNYSFEQLQEQQKPIEIKKAGLLHLSETANGVSTIIYKPDFLEENEAFYLKHLLHDSTPWNDKNIVIRGVEYQQPRLVAWYGPYPYSYSGLILEAAEMPDSILHIKKKIESFLEDKSIIVSFNSVLLNCYRDGKDSVAWHSDDELSMGIQPTIASISLGATRKFEMKRKEPCDEDEKNISFINLTHGSLLIMTGCMQQDWMHRVPKEFHHKHTRINLTFRTVYELDKSPGVFPKVSRMPSKSIDSTLFTKNKVKEENIFDDDDFPQLTSSYSNASNDKSRNLNSSFRNDGDLDDSLEYFDVKSDYENAYETAEKLSITINNDKQNNLDTVIKTEPIKDYSYSNIKMLEDENESFNVEDYNMDYSINSPANSSCSSSNKTSNSSLNVNAAEFVPLSPISHNNVDFNSLSLDELLDFPFNELVGDVLLNHAYALIKIIQNKLLYNFFQYEIRDFEFLSELTDGSQTDKNQKLITGRICRLVKSNFARTKRPQNFYSKSRDMSRRKSDEGGRVYKKSDQAYTSRHSNENRRKSQENQKNYTKKRDFYD